MEQRLIDAKALIDTFETKKAKAHEKSIKHLYGQNKNDKLYRKDRETESRCEYVLSVLRTTPTVDAVPVIHAKWVQNPYSDEPPTCSHCGFESSYYYDRSKSVIENRNGVLLSEAKSKYCPNCGAKMDGADGERRSDEDQHIYD